MWQNFNRSFRPINVLFVCLAQVLSVRFLADINFQQHGLVGLFLLVSVSVLTTIGAYISNDLLDEKRDEKNGKKRSLWVLMPTFSWILYILISIFSLYLAAMLSRQFMLSISIVLLFCLWYSYVLKNIAFLGNIVAAATTSFGIFVLYLLYDIDLILLLFFSTMSFLINYNRELVKDIIDLHGDEFDGAKTTPVFFGLPRTIEMLKFSLTSTFFILVFAAYYLSKNYFFGDLKILFNVYILFFLIFPIGFSYFLLMKKNVETKFQHISLYLKIVLYGGIILICLF